ncbi:MAG: PAS domain S-box protein [Proteobacteria bacterium]|nr:PAS domain S-box protein [Pseudomonadota bacterium]
MTSIKEALHQSEERYRSLLEDIEDGYIELDLAGDLTFWNSSFRRFLGYDESLMQGMSYKEYMKPDNYRRVYLAFNHVFKTGIPNKAFDYEITGADGTVRIAEISIALRRNAKGFGGNNATGVVFSPRITLDIMERRHGRKALKEHSRRNDGVVQKADEYDRDTTKGKMDPIYRFGDDVLEEKDLDLTDQYLRVPGYGKPIDLNLRNPYAVGDH